MEIFGELERIAADLYPYRWPITIGLAVVVVAALAMAYLRGWRLVVWRHKVASALAAGALLAIVIPAGNYLLSPLWERSHLEEASPLAEAVEPTAGEPTATAREPTAQATASAAEDSPAPTEAPAFEPGVVAQGEVSGADDFHFGEGRALLIETAPGQYTLRFEEFSVRNGPDLFVYLTPDKNSVEGAINLGDLKATDGAFNYEVPSGTDVPQYQYAVVWCRQFAVLFASAPLEAA